MTIDTTPTLAEVELAKADWDNGGEAEAEQLGADWDDWAEAKAAEQLSRNLSRFLDTFAAKIDHATTAQLERAEGALARHQGRPGMSATAQATNHITDVRPDPRPAHGWVWVCICGDDAAGFPNQAAAIEAAVNHEDGRVPLWG